MRPSCMYPSGTLQKEKGCFNPARVISVAVTYYRLRNHKNYLKYSGTSKISIGRDYKNV